MCGRYTFRNTPSNLGSEDPKWQALWKNIKVTQPRYNIAPSQAATIVGTRDIAEKAFGIKPEWSKASLINAKQENLISSRFWKPKVAMHPCLIPADGFYEPKGEKGTKRPWYGFELEDSDPFFMAGLVADEGFVIITKEPSLVVGKIHSRMPVILDSSQFESCELWLDTTKTLNDRVGALGEMLEYTSLTSFPVGDAVKNPRNEGAELFIKI